MSVTAAAQTAERQSGKAERPTMSPLPLAPFEQYMLLDDRPAYPMHFFVCLHFAGRLERDPFLAACRAAAARHPLLGARVARRGRGRWHWEIDAPLPPPVVWSEGAPAEGPPPAAPIDLARQPGLRIAVQQSAATASATFQFHHAACDGLGAFQMIGETLLLYAIATGAVARDALPPPPNPALLRRRGAFGMNARQLAPLLPRQLVGLTGAGKFLLRRPVPVCGGPAAAHAATDDALPADWPAARSHRFDEGETAALRAAARRAGGTANDLLARDLFLTLADWRRNLSFHSEKDWLRLCVPINLGGRDDRRLPAANVVSMVFLDRRAGETRDAAALLRSIRSEMDLIGRHRLGLTFVLALALADRLFGSLRGIIPGDKCNATAVLSNVGEVFGRLPLPRDGQQRIVLGGAALDAVDFLSPLRPQTNLAVGAVRYRGRQTVTLHYNPRAFFPPQAQALLEDYRRRLQRSTCTADEPAPNASPK